MKTVIVYGSATGTTEGIALDLGTAFSDATVWPVVDVSAEMLAECDLLILGASTWGFGDLQDDMAEFLDRFADWNLKIPFGAVFGLGDQISYADTFVDGMADMADALKNKGIQLIGSSPSEDYEFSESRAQANGRFIGLALDQDNESEKSNDRLITWIKQLQNEMEE